MKNSTSIESDFLILGSGLAGLFAALCASRHGTVTVLSKSGLPESSSSWAQGGIAAAIAADDSPALHLEDTLRAGRGLCNRQAVEILTQEAPLAIQSLQSLGVVFDQNAAGEIDFGREGGHSRRRVLHSGGSATGESFISVLIRRVRENPQIQVLENTGAVDLMSDSTRCFGTIATHAETKKNLLLRSPRTILATGGAAGLFERTTNPPTSTGEGIALAYRAGAEVMDMEFMQFHPTALHIKNGKTFLISEAIRGEGAYLLNAKGCRFMPDYHELAELAPRDIVASAIYKEMTTAGSDCVYLSLLHLDANFIRRRFTNIYESCLAQGIDITSQPIPVAPAAHYMIGGVRTDLQAKTSLEGLWACGEVACTGAHGANRLASNSLLECLVFARRAVESASEYLLKQDFTASSDQPLNILNESHLIHTPDLGKLLNEYVGIVRSHSGLIEARQRLLAIMKANHKSSSEMGNHQLVASMMIEAALLRQESRGVHLRSDFPAENPDWQKHIAFQKGKEPRFLCI